MKTNRQTKKPIKVPIVAGVIVWRKNLSWALIVVFVMIKHSKNTLSNTQLQTYRGNIKNNMDLCHIDKVDHYFGFFLKKGQKISFNINFGDPQKKHLVQHAGGSYKFLMVATGSQCYTIDTTNRFQFIGFYIKNSPDAGASNPNLKFSCSIDRLIITNEIVPCVGGETYQAVESMVTTNYLKNLGKRIDNSWSSIRAESRLLLKVNLQTEVGPMLDFNNNLFTPSDVNDDLIECMVLKAFMNSKFINLNQYVAGDFNTQRGLLSGHGIDYTTQMFLKSISHDRLYGYHFFPDPSKSDGRLSFMNNEPIVATQKGAHYQFYVQKPLSFTSKNIAVIEYELVKRFSAHKLISLYYKILLFKQPNDKIRIQLDRLDRTDKTTVINSIQIEVEITKNDEFIHFGFYLAEGLFYYTSDAEADCKFYEAVWAWHDHQRYLQHADYGQVEKYEEIIGYDPPKKNYYVMRLRYKNYLKRDYSQTSVDNLFGIRYYMHTTERAAYPLHKFPFSRVDSTSQDTLDRCGFYVFSHSRCAGYAPMKKKGDTLTRVVKITYTTRTNFCPTDKCYFCIDRSICLIPKEGYNRELTTTKTANLQVPVELVSSYEGSSPEAAAKRANRAEFFDNLGNKFWIECPVECKTETF